MYKYNMGGSVPRETNIQGQRHSLAYINPFEEDLLNTQYRGGEGQPMPPVPGPGGVPAYPPAGRSGGSGYTTTAPKTTTYKRGSGRDERLQEEANKNKAANLQKTLDTLASTAARQNEIDANKYAAEVSTPEVIQFAETLENLKTMNNMLANKQAAETLIAATPSAVNIFGDTNPNLGTGYTAPPKVSVVTGETATSPLAVETSVRPRVRPDDLKGERDGIMGVVDKIGSGFKTILSDIQMGITANPFGSPDQQRANLKAAGYSDFEIDEYFLATAETQERMKNQTNAPRGDDDNTMAAVAVAADPCPEGYKLDPITQQCVMDDTIDVLNPGGQQVTDFVMPSVNPVIGQAANYTGAVAPTYTPNPLQPYAPGVAGNLLQASAPGLARTPAMRNGGSVGGIMGLPR